MPAFPVAPPTAEEFLKTQGVFERGDKLFITSPVQPFTPSSDQVEEFAFASQIKAQANNEHIAWYRGQYVEADRPNANGAMWEAEELAIKSLTPTLMPVTVMHDPRTAVGTIAETKLLTPEKDGVPRARIDTVIALWAHRFPEAAQEAEVNAKAGTLMQSMECFSPWYSCSECGAVYQKQPRQAEEAGWCAHLRASHPGGTLDNMSAEERAAQSSNASRILGDVTFTGTGLIFGSRGARGAYSEAYLERFQDELAVFHETAHHVTHTSTATDRSTSKMGLVQIEDTELANLRKERDDARADAATEKTAREAAESAKAEAETAAQTAEAAKATAESEKADAVKERDDLKAAAEQEELAKTRKEALGSAFVEKIDSMPTTKAKLEEQAKTLSDDDWKARLTELEETTSVKSDAQKDGDDAPTGDTRKEGEYSDESIAALAAGRQTTSSKAPSAEDRSAVVGKLGKAFAGASK